MLYINAHSSFLARWWWHYSEIKFASYLRVRKDGRLFIGSAFWVQIQPKISSNFNPNLNPTRKAQPNFTDFIVLKIPLNTCFL